MSKTKETQNNPDHSRPFHTQKGLNPATLIPFYLRKKWTVEQQISRFLNDAKDGRFGPVAPEVGQALDYGVKTLGGKRARPVLAYVAHDLVGGDFPQIDQAAIIPELPHKGSLIEDDIVDHATQREGKEPVYKKFGMEVAREVYEFLYCSPQFIVDTLDIPDATKTWLLADYQDHVAMARDGQAVEARMSEDSSRLFFWDIYRTMAEWKCAAFMYAVRVGGKLADASDQQMFSLTWIARESGISFQILDDMQSLKKGSDDYGSDISEGKRTMQVNFVLNCKDGLPEGQRLREILDLRTKDPNLIDEATDIILSNLDTGLYGNYIEFLTDQHANLAHQSLERNFPLGKPRDRMATLIEFCRAGKLQLF